MAKKKQEGWANLPNLRKAHFFREGRALCARYGYFGDDFEEDELPDSPDNCTVCNRKRKKELGKP